MNHPAARSLLMDRFGRRVTYLRISITDRCDLRCVYCMSEDMSFLPRHEILSLEEISFLASVFVRLGVDKIRITGGEPLVRRGAVHLLEEIGRLPGLKELVMTTNGMQLEQQAAAIRAAGVRRINVSLDTLQPERFARMTRVGELDRVLRGLASASAAGFERIKLNAVILRGQNEDDVLPLVRYALAQGFDLSFIEEMPLGVVDSHDRAQAYYSSDEIARDIRSVYPLESVMESSGGPARYFRIPGHASRIGFISPHSHNFCGDCNRVRLTAEGRLLLCLGNEHSVDLRAVLRESAMDADRAMAAIVAAMAIKPERHEFVLGEQPVILRHMNRTGG